MRRRWMWVLLIAAALAVPSFADQGAPKCTHRDMPSYPALLRSLKIGGHVKLRLKVSAEGKVKDTKLEGGNPMLGELSSIAAKKWTYAPAANESEVLVELVFDPAVNEPKVVE